MTIFTHILVPIDFSAASNAALELAVGTAEAFGAELTLLHVWEVPVYPYSDFVLSSTDLLDNIQKAAEKRLAKALAEVKARTPRVSSVLHMGVPWQVILESIPKLKADLVVMGTHGRHGLTHAILGSVAEKVVRLSPVPVLTAHAPTA